MYWIIKTAKITKIILLILFSLGVYAILSTMQENYQIRQEIKTFMAKGVLDESRSNDTIKYYVVSRETWMIEKDAFVTVGQQIYPGTMGDIFVTQEAPSQLPPALSNIPLIHEFVSFFFGGHSAMVAKDDLSINLRERDVLEVYGNDSDMEKNVVGFQRNYWLEPNNLYRDEVIGLRVKGATIRDYESAVDQLIDRLGEKYNFTFLLNTKTTHYCTDLMVKAWEGFIPQNQSTRFNLNQDWIVTTVNDLITSSDTYIFYYMTVDVEGVIHVYHVG